MCFVNIHDNTELLCVQYVTDKQKDFRGSLTLGPGFPSSPLGPGAPFGPAGPLKNDKPHRNDEPVSTNP